MYTKVEELQVRIFNKSVVLDKYSQSLWNSNPAHLTEPDHKKNMLKDLAFKRICKQIVIISYSSIVTQPQ